MNVAKLIAVLWFGVGMCLIPTVVDAQDQPTKEELRKNQKETRRLLKAGSAGFETGDYQSSRAALDSALTLDSKNPDAFYYLARISFVQGDTARADSMCTEGVKSAPKSSRLKLYLARIKLGQGQPEVALEMVNSVLAIKPRESEALYLKGWALLNSDQLEAAVEVLQQAIEVAIEKGDL